MRLLPRLKSPEGRPGISYMSSPSPLSPTVWTFRAVICIHLKKLLCFFGCSVIVLLLLLSPPVSDTLILMLTGRKTSSVCLSILFHRLAHSPNYFPDISLKLVFLFLEIIGFVVWLLFVVFYFFLSGVEMRPNRWYLQQISSSYLLMCFAIWYWKLRPGRVDDMSMS